MVSYIATCGSYITAVKDTVIIAVQVYSYSMQHNETCVV